MMHLLFLIIVGITTFGTAYPYAINNVDAMKQLAEILQKRVWNKVNVEKESPTNEKYQEFYDVLSDISVNVQLLYTLTLKENFGELLDDIVGMYIGSDQFLQELAYNLSEINTLQDFAELVENLVHTEVTDEQASMILYTLSLIQEPLEIISSEFRVLFRKWYQWAKKTNFAYDFPLRKYTSVEEVEMLIEDTELFAQKIAALLDTESVDFTPNATENHMIAVRLLEYKTFIAFYVGEGLDDLLGLQWWPAVQKWMSLMQSKEMKKALFGLSRDIPELLNLLEAHGILGLREPFEYDSSY